MSVQQSLKRNREVYGISTLPQDARLTLPESGTLTPPASPSPPSADYSGETEIVFTSERIVSEAGKPQTSAQEQIDRVMRIRARRRPQLTMQEEPEEI